MNARGMTPGSIDTNYVDDTPPDVEANHRGIIPGADGLEKPGEAPAAKVEKPEETRTAAEDTRTSSADQADVAPKAPVVSKPSSPRGRSGRSRK